MRDPFIALAGESMLTALLQQELTAIASTEVIDAEASQLPVQRPLLVVGVQCGGQMGDLLKWEGLCRAAHLPFLPVWLRWEEACVGPWSQPGEAGCLACAEFRTAVVRSTENHGRDIPFDGAGPGPEDLPYPLASLLSITSVVRAEVIDYLNGGRVRLACAVYVTAMHRLVGRVHRFLPVSACPQCGQMEEDRPPAVVLQSRPKPNPRILRVNPALPDLDQLRTLYADYRTGVVAHEQRMTNSPLVAYCRAELPDQGESAFAPGVGRGLNYHSSYATAILEALERYAGFRPLRVKTAVRASRCELGARAIDVNGLALHDQVQHASLPFRQYADDLTLNWVWGYSFRRSAPVLIPETAAYYRLLADPGRPREQFAYETSNGCALGACFEEAVLYGLLEIIERDAFLLTWYTRSEVGRLSAEGLSDWRILAILDGLEHRGYRVHLFNITSDFGVPALWVMAEGVREGTVATFSSAGAHLDPEKALLGALVEIASVLPAVEATALGPEQQIRAAEMLQNPDLVRSMEDHGLLYSHPAARTRLAFLLEHDTPPVPFQDAFPDWYQAEPPTDLTEDLRRLVARTLQLGLDIYVVDQTPPEQEVLGLRTLRVLVPGTLPMTFGHRNRRIHGVDRLLTVPYQLGYRSAPLRPAELNLDPHPFP